MKDEVWKPCPDFELDYEVSSEGRVRRIRAATASGPVGLIMSQRKNECGYVFVCLRRHKERQKNVAVHRLVARAFLKEPPGGTHEVNHINAVKHDNCLCNLEWVTPRENARHAISLGRWTNVRGSRHPAAKLDESRVSSIRTEHNQGHSICSLARKYGVTRSTIGRVVHKEHWRHC